jgi:phage tail-like protein
MSRRDDWLIHQLPVGMVEDEFLVRFLRIFQTVSETMLHEVDQLPYMFDPTIAPDNMVRAMGAWLGVDWVDSSLPDALQRQIVREYASLVQWRGTRRGLSQLLSLVSGAPATVEDNGGVYLEGESTGEAPHVRLAVESVGWATEADLVRIVRGELPAQVTFELSVGDRLVWPPQPDAWRRHQRDLPTVELPVTGASVTAGVGTATLASDTEPDLTDGAGPDA